MNADAREPWDELMKRLARAKGFGRLTPVEARAEYEAAVPVRLPEDQIDRIVRNVVTGRLPPHPRPAPARPETLSEVDQETFALNRNVGELDADTKRKLEKLRVEALAAMRTEKTTFDWKIEERRQELAGEKADEVLATFGYSVPVDPCVVASGENRRIAFRGADFGNMFDGQIEYHAEESRFLIFFNTKYDRDCSSHHARTRFSIAHELGHYYLDEHREYLLRGGAPHTSRGEFASELLREREADAFAATLLLPTKEVRAFVNAQPFALSVVESLASTFQVSLVSAAIRAVKLCHFPAAVAGLRPGARPWLFTSRAFNDAGCWRRPGDSLPSDAARKMLARFVRGSADRSSADSRLSAWFNAKDGMHSQSSYVTEEYVPIASMGMLLVIISADEDDLFKD